MVQCKATAKSTGERCRRHAVTGYEVCEVHGGLTPRGEDSPHYQGKGRSKYLPSRLRNRYEEALGDPDLTDMKRVVALRETFIGERLESMEESPDSRAAWKEVARLVSSLETAYTTVDNAGMVAGLRGLRALLRDRERYNATREEVEQALSEQRRDIDALKKNELAGEKAISAAELGLFLGALLQVVREVVTSQQEINELERRVDQLLTLP